jgi:hypothetical protein
MFKPRFSAPAVSYRAGRAQPECCEDCKCGDYCDGCPTSISSYQRVPIGAVRRYRGTSLRGDDDGSSLRSALTSSTATTAAAVALTYHGYKRTGSLVWAAIYGLAGKAAPLFAVPVALAQGFGKAKQGC